MFGGSSVGINGTLELSALNGGNGFVLNGVSSGDTSGYAVSAVGDINADGVADLLIGATQIRIAERMLVRVTWCLEARALGPVA